MEFLYFDLRNNPKGEFRKVRANKEINIVDYKISKIREVEPNVYLMVYKKDCGNASKEDPFFKHFIVDANKDEPSASVHQISLPFNNDPKFIEMQKKSQYCYSYFINLGEVWVFRIHYKN